MPTRKVKVLVRFILAAVLFLAACGPKTAASTGESTPGNGHGAGAGEGSGPGSFSGSECENSDDCKDEMICVDGECMIPKLAR